MKTVLAFYLVLSLLGYKIGIPTSERELDEKDCELWKYEDPDSYKWCMFAHTPEII